MGQITRYRYEAGMSVCVVDCRELREWMGYRNSIGKIAVLDSKQAYKLNREESVILFDNEYAINFTREMLKPLPGDWDI